MISIHLINYNNAESVDEFIEPFEEMKALIGPPVEVILVDNHSDDGSWEVLSDIADIAVQSMTHRGQARRMCYELSKGSVCIDQVDTDQRAQPEIAKIANWMHENEPGFCINTNGCMINQRAIVNSVGGFGEYHSGEDKYLWDRLIEVDRYVFLDVNTAHHIVHNHDRGPPSYNPLYDYPRIHRMHLDQKLQQEILGD